MSDQPSSGGERSPRQTDDLPRSGISWQSGWPSAQVSGLHTIRLIIVPADSQMTESLGWQISVGTNADISEGVQLTGDVTVAQHRWFLSIGVGTVITFAEGERPPTDNDDQLDDVLLTYGPWAAHAMWDYARAVLQSAAAGVPFRDERPDLPSLTPVPVLVTSEIRKGRVEQDGADED